MSSLVIEQFPNHAANRQYCFVWTRKDGARVVFGCDTQENCEKNLDYWKARAEKAEQNGWEQL